MDLRIAITDDLNSEREKLSSAIIAPFSKVGLNVGNIDEYTSGEELLRQFSAGRYDLIFLDIYMGGMSGVKPPNVSGCWIRMLCWCLSPQATSLQAKAMR